ncbi:unnamed protein product [Cercospora beticola]|nr:unnamed protein product [Cercospora beticola]
MPTSSSHLRRPHHWEYLHWNRIARRPPHLPLPDPTTPWEEARRTSLCKKHKHEFDQHDVPRHSKPVQEESIWAMRACTINALKSIENERFRGVSGKPKVQSGVSQHQPQLLLALSPAPPSPSRAAHLLVVNTK